MQSQADAFDAPLDGLNWTDWLSRMGGMIGDAGFVEPLGAAHAAVFRAKGPVLLVSFENHDRVEEDSPKAHPMGWPLVKALGWSHLSLLSNGDTWFRDGQVYGFFDRLIDDGFFDEFERVIFYGAGPCGYAAAAFSVAAPGARVLAIQPQATLDPRIAEWDDRYLAQRRVAFDDRYGYAPDMLDAAKDAVVLYDPEIELDAMHAALFTRPNVMKFRMRHLGPRLEISLDRMQIMLRILAQLSAGKLTRLNLARLYRARRTDPAYQFSLLKHTTRDERHLLTMRLARAVLAQRNAPPFRKALNRAESILMQDQAASEAV
ncbi:phosphoadenosine phosphosulfate reductase [Roseovarius faecimaris]|uniref:Phosphoadenosine phosphosulfate reductase n=1 Tax=Roseovarius faecimaris TaxID=2494550 RepID=A0A6I6IQE7_9RHOB|nr:phosphoadenosine phosphosulfate reductase [Roseovarius faecimaris]QGX98063.1 phosphoadenosine phosphosulfate reductase [Roseovarius faecimaris]